MEVFNSSTRPVAGVMFSHRRGLIFPCQALRPRVILLPASILCGRQAGSQGKAVIDGTRMDAEASSCSAKPCVCRGRFAGAVQPPAQTLPASRAAASLQDASSQPQIPALSCTTADYNTPLKDVAHHTSSKHPVANEDSAAGFSVLVRLPATGSFVLCLVP